MGYAKINDSKKGYICTVDFDIELGVSENGVTIYSDIEEANKCIFHNCGAYEIEIVVKKILDSEECKKLREDENINRVLSNINKGKI